MTVHQRPSPPALGLWLPVALPACNVHPSLFKRAPPARNSTKQTKRAEDKQDYGAHFPF